MKVAFLSCKDGGLWQNWLPHFCFSRSANIYEIGFLKYYSIRLILDEFNG